MMRHIAIFSLLFSPLAMAAGAASDADDAVRTAYINARYGLATYKSELVAANDTGGVVAYAIGLNAGQNKNLGVQISRDQSQQTFTLNKSSIKNEWQDISLTYRWAYVYFGPTINQMNMTTNSEGNDLFSVIGSGYGGRLGFLIPIGRSWLVTDLSSTTYGSITEKDEKPVTVGPRLDVDLGAHIPITRRNLAVLVGYHYRRYGVGDGQKTYVELQTQTYLGFQWGGDF